jgi:hypothetical protein
MLLDQKYRNPNIRDKIQKENRHRFSRKRKNVLNYHDLVMIKCIQQGVGLKLTSKYLGPYKIVKVLRNNRYVVRKMSAHE